MKVVKRNISIETLKRDAILYVGLPENYDNEKKRYPVLYMHDGHNLFFKEDSYSGSTWKVREAFEKGDLPDVIIVALSCAEGIKRLDEYGPFPFTIDVFDEGKTPGGEGEKYLDYIVHNLKPIIDKHYRTKSDANSSYMMGSSMGGVISLYAAIKYSHVFSSIASLSGSFFVSYEPFITCIQNADFSQIKRLYIDTGDAEIAGGKPKDYIIANEGIFKALKEKMDSNQIRYHIIPDGVHNEAAWAERFPGIVRWLIE